MRVAELCLIPWVALIFASCAHQTALSQHDWYRPAPKEAFTGLARVAPADVFPVVEDKIENAVQRLREMAAIQITDADVVELAGLQLNVEGDYVLLRGLCTGCGTGMFYVYVGGGRVVVDNLSLASGNALPKPWPVVVKLSDLPRDVYVQHSSAK